MNHTCNPTTAGYSSVPCHTGGLPHTGLDLGFTLALAAILVALGLLLRKAARRG